LKAADFFKASNPWLAKHSGFDRPTYARRLVWALRWQKTVGRERNLLRA
jgi:hypothetical protein